MNDTISYLSARQLALRWGLSMSTLRTWRQRKYGPKFFKPAGQRSRTRYKLADIEAWEREHTNA